MIPAIMASHRTARAALDHKRPGMKKQRKASGALTRGNSTILIGANLISVVAGFNGPAPLTAIAAQMRMSPSRAYRYLRGLCDCGFLEQDRPSGHYDLGPQMINLGLTAISRMDPVRQAALSMPALADATGLVSAISVWGSHGPTAIRAEHGNLIAPVRVREGLHLPLLTSAAGKVFLTYMPQSVTAELLEKELAEWNARNSGRNRITPAKVDSLCAEVRRHGLARAIGTHHPMLAMMAAPVFNREGVLELAITLIGIKGSFDISLRGGPAKQLLATAHSVSGKLGAHFAESAPLHKDGKSTPRAT
jgi:DNA-binding IclR family transcriptional regulator